MPAQTFPAMKGTEPSDSYRTLLKEKSAAIKGTNETIYSNFLYVILLVTLAFFVSPPPSLHPRPSCRFLLMSPCQFNDRKFHAMSTYACRGQFRIVGRNVGSVGDPMKGTGKKANCSRRLTQSKDDHSKMTQRIGSFCVSDPTTLASNPAPAMSLRVSAWSMDDINQLSQSSHE